MSDQYSRAQDGAHDGDDAGDASPATLTSARSVCPGRGTLGKHELQLFAAGCAWASLYGMELADIVSVEVAATAGDGAAVDVATTQFDQPLVRSLLSRAPPCQQAHAGASGFPSAPTAVRPKEARRTAKELDRGRVESLGGKPKRNLRKRTRVMSLPAALG